MTCSTPREVPAMRNIFWQTLKKNGLLLVVLIAAIIASIAVSVTPPLILQYIVDSLVSGSFSAYPLLTAGILYFALNAGSGLVDALKETLITVFGQKITHGLRSAMCQRLDECRRRTSSAMKPVPSRRFSSTTSIPWRTSSIPASSA